MINQLNYLDLGNFFINEVVGSFWLFIFLMVIVLSYYGVKNNIPVNVLMTLLVVAGFVVSASYYSSVILLVIGLVVSFIVYGLMARYISK